MAFRILCLAAALLVFCGAFPWKGDDFHHHEQTKDDISLIGNVPRNGTEFRDCLRRLGLKPGPLGYFNSAYMAFTPAEARKFPNLVSYRRNMRRIKTYNITWKPQAPVQSRKNIFKRGSSFPVTTLSGPCESTIGGETRLCDVCPAVTDLGPETLPRYINEVLCNAAQLFCGDGSTVLGLCQNPTVTQSFIKKIDSTWMVYSQEIRVCCECAVFFWPNINYYLFTVLSY